MTILPINWGLNTFQSDYILARETFSLKTPVAFVPCQTNPVMQLLSDLSYSDYLTSNFCFTQTHTLLKLKGEFQPKTLLYLHKKLMLYERFKNTSRHCSFLPGFDILIHFTLLLSAGDQRVHLLVLLEAILELQ